MRQRDAEILRDSIREGLPSTLALTRNTTGAENGWYILVFNESLGRFATDDYYAGARWIDAQIRKTA